MSEYIDKKQIMQLFLPREKDCHKGSFGKCAIFGSSQNYVGAIKLSALGAISMRMGVGYTTLAVIESQISSISPDVFECTISPQKEIDGHFQFDKIRVDQAIKNAKSVAVGMGMTKNEETRKLVKYLFDNFSGSLVVDADGINSIDEKMLAEKRTCELVLTPHFKEFSILTNLPIDTIKRNDEKIAMEFAKKYNLILHLKSESSVTSNGEKCFRVFNSSPSLAKASSGDFLAGAIVGLSANHDAFLATSSVSQIIADVARRLSEKYNENVLLARDFEKGIRDYFINLK